MASDEYKYLGYGGTCTIINTMATCRCSINKSVNTLITNVINLKSSVNSLVTTINEKLNPSQSLSGINIELDDNDYKSNETTFTEISGSDKTNYYLGESGSNKIITTLAECRNALNQLFSIVENDLSCITEKISEIIDVLDSLGADTSSLSESLENIEESISD